MPRPLPQETKQAVVEMYDAGVRVAEIAQRTGVERCFVYKIIKKAGRQTSKPRQHRTMTVSSVSCEDYEWLLREARRMRSTVADLARAMLTDAIDEARNGQG